jgi:ATP-dependent DNA helicase RecQ
VLAAAALAGKALRLRLAKERQVPAYVVFSDRTLIDMAERRPHEHSRHPFDGC